MTVNHLRHISIAILTTAIIVLMVGSFVLMAYAQDPYKKFNEDMNKQIEKFRKQQEEINRQRDYDLIPRIPPPTRPPLGDRDEII